VADERRGSTSAAHPAARETDTDSEFFAAFYEVLVARIDQSRQAGETVQRAATAIATFYGVVLGLAFSVTDNPLPAHALIPGVLLGFALVAATIYLAWQGGQAQQRTATVHPERESDAFLRRRAFLIDFQGVVADFIQRGRWWLRAAVISLALGVVALPLPFLTG
jgi:hypothetical protein